MKQIAITSNNKFLALMGDNGLIEVEGDLMIACKVPWLKRDTLQGLRVTGSLLCFGGLTRTNK